MQDYLPLVSVVIPVYNGANYLREAIDSALAQTYQNIEIIVVNDGSTDNGATESIALSYGDRIRYFCKENGGCASALNFGISKMCGEWFSWLSHDDLYLPEKIDKSIDVIRKQKLFDGMTMVQCGMCLIDQTGARIFRPVKKQFGARTADELFADLWSGGGLNGCALLIHKHVLERVGSFNEQLAYIPDFEYWVRAALCGVGLFSFEEQLVKTRVHRAQVSVYKRDRLKPEMSSLIRQLTKNFAENGNVAGEKIVVLLCYAKASSAKTESRQLQQMAKTRGLLTMRSQLAITWWILRRKVRNIVRWLYRLIFKKGID